MDIQDETVTKTIALRVARWGNSLAVRLPVAYVRRANLLDGDTLVLAEAADGTLSLTPHKPFDRAAFVRKLKRTGKETPLGESTVEQMRRENRY